MTAGDYTVTITATDAAGGAGIGTFAVHVPVNIAPTITGLTDKPVVAGLPARFDIGTLDDPDGNGPWAVVVEWGDGTRATSLVMRTGGALPQSWHTYATPGDYPVTITATDTAGGVGTGTFTVHVPVNIAPTITGLNDKPVVAGLPAQFDLGVLDDADGNGPWGVTVDWGDGSRATSFTMRTGGALPQSWHNYTNPGDYTIAITAIDTAGGIGRGAFIAHVPPNIPPTITDIADRPAVAGVPAMFSLGVLNDPDGNGPWAVTVDWGDQTRPGTYTRKAGPTELTGGALPPTWHTYMVPGDYVVTITATDRAGGVGRGTFTVHVPPNIVPTITGLNNVPAVAGQPSRLDLGVLNDPDGNGPWAMVINWGDQTKHATFSMKLGGALPAIWHTYMTPGDYTVTVTATDAAGGIGTGAFTVHVPPNRPPEFTGLNNRPAVAARSMRFDLGTLTDPDGNGPWKVAVDWGDAERPTTFTMRTGGTVPPTFHTYAVPGDYLVTISATDAAGGLGAGTFTVHVPENIPPMVTGLNDKPVTAGVPTRFNLGMLTDPDGNGPWKVVVDWGDQTRLTTFTMQAGGTLPQTWHVYVHSGDFTVTISVTDAAGGVGVGTFLAQVPPNRSPTVTEALDRSALPGQVIRLPLGTLDDADGNGPWAISVDWGDGSLRTTFVMRALGVLPRTWHTYLQRGSYTVTVTATDAAGAVGQGYFTTTVN